MHFILYSRGYCHLCDDMLAALNTWMGERPCTIDVVDVDADEALLALYDELVPVLVGSRDGQAPVRLCHYFLDMVALSSFVTGQPAQMHK